MLEYFFGSGINSFSLCRTSLLLSEKIPKIHFKEGRNEKCIYICSICEGLIFDGESMWAVSVQHEVSENCVIMVLDAKPEDTFPENYLDKIKPAESDIMFPPRIP